MQHSRVQATDWETEMNHLLTYCKHVTTLAGLALPLSKWVYAGRTENRTWTGVNVERNPCPVAISIDLSQIKCGMGENHMHVCAGLMKYTHGILGIVSPIS
jgi:hypothetical protein